MHSLFLHIYILCPSFCCFLPSTILTWSSGSMSVIFVAWFGIALKLAWSWIYETMCWTCVVVNLWSYILNLHGHEFMKPCAELEWLSFSKLRKNWIRSLWLNLLEMLFEWCHFLSLVLLFGYLTHNFIKF